MLLAETFCKYLRHQSKHLPPQQPTPTFLTAVPEYQQSAHAHRGSE
jgi:hypothetical protein